MRAEILRQHRRPPSRLVVPPIPSVVADDDQKTTGAVRQNFTAGLLSMVGKFQTRLGIEYCLPGRGHCIQSKISPTSRRIVVDDNLNRMQSPAK